MAFLLRLLAGMHAAFALLIALACLLHWMASVSSLAFALALLAVAVLEMAWASIVDAIHDRKRMFTR